MGIDKRDRMVYNACYYVLPGRGMEKVTICFKVPAEFGRAIKKKAGQMDATVSQVIRLLLRRWLAGEIDAIPPEGKEEESEQE